MKDRHPKIDGIVKSLIEKLEQMRQVVQPDKEADAAIVEDFALRLFTEADRVDRAGRANKLTAHKFYAACNFLEVSLQVTAAVKPSHLAYPYLPKFALPACQSAPGTRQGLQHGNTRHILCYSLAQQLEPAFCLQILTCCSPDRKLEPGLLEQQASLCI